MKVILAVETSIFARTRWIVLAHRFFWSFLFAISLCVRLCVCVCVCLCDSWYGWAFVQAMLPFWSSFWLAVCVVTSFVGGFTLNFLSVRCCIERLEKVMFFAFVAGAVCGNNCIGHGGASVPLGMQFDYMCRLALKRVAKKEMWRSAGKCFDVCGWWRRPYIYIYFCF